MKESRDYSMLYGALAGFTLYVLLVGWFVARTDGSSPAGPMYGILPDGYQIVEDSDTHTFRDGTRTFIVKIPSEASDSFAVSLKEKGFVNTPLTDDIYQKVKGDPEVKVVTTVTNGLWWFKDDSPEDIWGEYTNYDLHIYDLDTGIYYYFESDS